MRHIIPALAAVVIGVTGVTSAAHAAMVDFGVAALGGTITFKGGSTLDKSTQLDLDDALMIVTNVSSNDSSGLSVFPAGPFNTVTLTHPIVYGSGMGSVDTPITVVKTWNGFVDNQVDKFTETLMWVTDIDRDTPDAITITLKGMLDDSLHLFTDTPAELILNANQVGGGGTAISVSLTNKASNVPETSTWLMMALGFVGLGYAAVRRSPKDRSALAV